MTLMLSAGTGRILGNNTRGAEHGRFRLVVMRTSAGFFVPAFWFMTQPRRPHV
jgi:hypothetical protein